MGFAVNFDYAGLLLYPKLALYPNLFDLMKFSRTQWWLTVVFGVVLTTWIGMVMVLRQAILRQEGPLEWMWERTESYTFFNEILTAFVTADVSQQTYLTTGDDDALETYYEQIETIEGDRADFFDEAFSEEAAAAAEARAEFGEEEDDLDALEDEDWEEMEQERAYYNVLREIDIAITRRIQLWEQTIQLHQSGQLDMATQLNLLQQGKSAQFELQQHLQDLLDAEDWEEEWDVIDVSIQQNNALWISWLVFGVGMGVLAISYTWLMRTLAQQAEIDQKQRRLTQTVTEQETELRNTQAKLRTELNRRQELEATCQAIEEAKELTDLKLNFFSLASHELRTPLSAILVSAQLLDNPKAKWTEEKRSRNLRRIQSSAKTMTQLLADILLLTRAEAGKLEFSPTMIELENFGQQLVEEVSFNTQAQHKITVIRQGDCEYAYLDKTLVRAMLMSVLTNAIKYSPPESEITLTVLGEVDRTQFQIRDQGIGIPAADQKYLFESFRRGQNVKSISGTGLGLAVVKKCLDLHGGSIDVASEVGIGTRFTIDVPWADQSPDPKWNSGIRVSDQLIDPSGETQEMQ